MRSYLLLLVLGIVTSAQAAQAQFDIQTDEGNVTIGSDGIKVRQGGKTVNINQGGVSVKKPSETVRVKTSGITGSNSRNSVKINSGGVQVKKSGTASTRVKTTAVTGLSLDQRVANLEIQAYGKKSQGTLIARVEKLEADTIGAVGSGSISLRISKLATALGTIESTSETVTVKSVDVSGATPSVEIRSPGQRVDISGSGTAIKMNATAGSGGGGAKDIVIDNSGFEGTMACNGGNVVLNASTCNIKFTGPINALVLNGSSNDITCDTVRHVQVNGSANDVKWSRASNPSVDNAGSANTLTPR